MKQNDLSNEVLKTIRQIIRAIDLQSRKLAKTHGLTGPQLVVLKELAEYDEITIGDLSRKISLSQATVTNIIERLEHKGIVTRIRSGADKRKVFVKTTDKASLLLQNAPSLLQEGFVDNFNKLELWEKNLLLSSLQRVASMMNAPDISHLNGEPPVEHPI